MKNIAIVILNYLNYQDTIECVDSIYAMKYKIAGIVIVDNHSPNESYKMLRDEYKNTKNIKVICTRKNLGFAKGNNVGIFVARKKYKTDFIYVVNNDVIFEDQEYFKKLYKVYDKTTAVIGSKIKLKNEVFQKRCFAYVTFKEVLNEYICSLLVYRNKSIWIRGLPQKDVNLKKEILHGCGILFTPVFFQKYKGFYPKTFLYGEEDILYLMCEKYGLKQKYVESTYIFHKEDQSSEMSFQNKNEIKQKYSIQSYKYVVWWAFKNKIYSWIKKVY